VHGKRLKVPAFPRRFHRQNARQQAIDYALQRFGGGIGEICIYNEAADAVERAVKIDDGNRYS
jgi:hypothetical protein